MRILRITTFSKKNCIEFLLNEFTFSYNLSFSKFQPVKFEEITCFKVFIDAIFYAKYIAAKVFCIKYLDVIGLFEMKWLTHFDANIICKMTIQPVCHSNTSHALTGSFLNSNLNYLKQLSQEIFHLFHLKFRLSEKAIKV